MIWTTEDMCHSNPEKIKHIIEKRCIGVLDYSEYICSILESTGELWSLTNCEFFYLISRSIRVCLYIFLQYPRYELVSLQNIASYKEQHGDQ